MKALYRRIAGPDASFSALPLALARRLIGNHITVRSNDRPLMIDLRDSVMSFDLIFGRYEPDETRLVKNLLSPGDHAVDIGANIGYFTILFAGLVGSSGRVMAVEPDPENAELLRMNVRANTMDSIVSVVEAALGQKEDSLQLYRNATGNRGDHRLYMTSDTSWRQKKRRSAITVPVHRLDDLVRSWRRLDFIKMDIQGYEPVALEGMREALSRFAGIKLLTEFWPAGIQASGNSPIGYVRTLRSAGFELQEIVGDKLVAVDEFELLGRLRKSGLHTNILCERPDNFTAGDNKHSLDDND